MVFRVFPHCTRSYNESSVRARSLGVDDDEWKALTFGRNKKKTGKILLKNVINNLVPQSSTLLSFGLSNAIYSSMSRSRWGNDDACTFLLLFRAFHRRSPFAPRSISCQSADEWESARRCRERFNCNHITELPLLLFSNTRLPAWVWVSKLPQRSVFSSLPQPPNSQLSRLSHLFLLSASNLRAFDTPIEMNERAPNATLHNLTLIQRRKAEYEALKSYLCFMYYVKCHNMITRTGYFPSQFACLHISKSPMPLDDDDDDCLSSSSMFIAARLVYCVHSSNGVRKSHTENWKFVRRQCKAQKCKLELTYRKKRGVVKCQTNWICFFLRLLQHEISRS